MEDRQVTVEGLIGAMEATNKLKVLSALVRLLLEHPITEAVRETNKKMGEKGSGYREEMQEPIKAFEYILKKLDGISEHEGAGTTEQAKEIIRAVQAEGGISE